MVKIAEINNQNPWWTQEIEFCRHDFHLTRAQPVFFKRQSLNLETGNIYILRGCRQVGKTTYLKATVRGLIEKGVSPKQILYLSLDFFTSRRELRNAINYFLELTREVDKVYLLFDEITSLENWNLEFKYLTDQGITQKSTVIATGSSAIRLKEKGELLPGRGLEGNEHYFKPLSFREFVLQTVEFISDHISIKELKNSLEKLRATLSDVSIDLWSDFEHIKESFQKIAFFKRELQMLFRMYLITGGIPSIVNHYLVQKYEKNEEKVDRFLAEIFMRDVVGDISRLKKQETIARDILRGVVEKYGSRFSFTSLAQETGLYHQVSMDYLEFLENSFILFILFAYDFNEKRIKTKGAKKVFFLDPFVFNSIKAYLSGRDVWQVINDMLQSEEIQSHTIEGVVAAHLLGHKEIPYLRNGETFIWIYYDKQGKEIDTVIKQNSHYLGIEVKYQAQVDQRALKRIQPVRRYILLSKEDVAIGERSLIIPVDVFLSLLPMSERNL